MPAMMKKFARAVVGACLLLIGAATSSAAQDAEPNSAAARPDEALTFVKDLADEAMGVLNDTTLTQQERESEFRRILREGFDLRSISRLVLGRYRRTATRQQVAEFDDLFPEFVLKIYANRLTEYGDEELEIMDTVPAGKRDVFVRSQVVRPDGPPVSADWRVRLEGDKFMIVDLKVEGVSMVLTQRDEFSAKIASDGMDALIADIRSRTEPTPPTNSAQP